MISCRDRAFFDSFSTGHDTPKKLRMKILHFVQDDRGTVQDDRGTVQDDKGTVQDDRGTVQDDRETVQDDRRTVQDDRGMDGAG